MGHMIKIRIITPLCHATDRMLQDTLNEVLPLQRHGILFDGVVLQAGPESIESHFDEAFCAPYVVMKAMEAENEEIDAVIIDCMGDPGMMAAREAVSIPVVGPGEAAMHMAGMTGNRFSCVSILDSVRPILFAHAKVYGVADKLASVRTINVPVLELEKNLDRLPDLLYEQSVKAIEQDHADTIVLGCTGFVGVAERLQIRLREEAGYNVPVINPLPTAALLAATMVWGRMPHSRHAYHKPNLKKKFMGFTIPGTEGAKE
jgi:allantoin racemase